MRECPVLMGTTWRSMRSGEKGVVTETRYFGSDASGDWSAHLRMDDHRIRWVTCSGKGIVGYRQESP